MNKINDVLTGILLDSAKSVGALKGRGNPAFQRRNNWFDIEFHNQRTINRKKIREGSKTSNHSVKKPAAKEYQMLLLRKKSTWDSKTNKLLRQTKNIASRRSIGLFSKHLYVEKTIFHLKSSNYSNISKTLTMPRSVQISTITMITKTTMKS